MRVFIAGVMQGSLTEPEVTSQDYRRTIAGLLRSTHPDAEIIDPWEIHPYAVDYSMDKARQTLLEELELASSCDVLVAYLPQASMGTALEMWHAWRAGAKIYTITPMRHNWVINLVSTKIFPNLESFAEFIRSGGLEDHG